MIPHVERSVRSSTRPRITMHALDDSMSRVGAHAPDALVSPAARASIGSIAAHIPAALTSWQHLECRLDDSSDVDLIVQIEEHGPSTLLLALTNELPRGNPWRDAALLARDFGDSSSDRAVARVWLEFDVGDRSANASFAKPSLFGELTPIGARGVTPMAHDDAIARVLHYIGPFSTAQSSGIDRCRAALPPRASVFALGVMRSRPGAPVRLCVTGIRNGDLGDFLRRCNWPGDIATIVAAHERFWHALTADGRREDDHIGILHLDLEAGALTGRLGAEYMLDRHAQIRGRIAESAFLDVLTSTAGVRPDKVAALRSWPGVSRVRLPHLLWPSVAIRRVNHIKVVADADARLSAKAYLCAGERWPGSPEIDDTEHGRQALLDRSEPPRRI